MIRGVLLCFVGLLLIESRLFAGQTKPRKLNDSDAKVERSDSRPDLAAKFDDVAQLKIASRKSLFHVGEMITIDIALLNTSSQPLFFRKPVEMHINVVTGTGQQMIVQEYVVIDRAIVPASFVRLSPGEIIVNSFQLLAGCDKRAFAQIASTADEDRTVFN